MISTKKVFIGITLFFVVCMLFFILLFSMANTFPIISSPSDNEEVSDAELSALSARELFSLGQQYFNHDDSVGGNYDLGKARTYYTALLQRNPEAHMLAWHQLGRIDFLEGKFNAAIYKFNKQIQYFGDDLPNVYYMLGLTYGYQARQSGRVEEWEKAEEYFKKYIEYDPTSPWPRVDLAWIYFAQGKFEEMKSVLEPGLDAHPANAWLLNMEGLSLLNTGNKESAYKYFVEAKTAADILTTEEWGKSYPGNDPAIWERGLNEFRVIIEKNITLAKN